jgi:hypothetical protein
MIREMLSFVNWAAKKASYVLKWLINISFFIAYHSFNKSEKSKVKKRKYPAFYDQARIAAQCTPWKQEAAAYRFEYWNYFDKCKSW